MKKQGIVNIAGSFEAGALRVLRKVPGLTVVAETTPRKRGVDAVLEAAGRGMPVAVEFRRNVSAATAWQLVHLATARPGLRLLVIAGNTTAKAREILEGNGIAVVDGLGNVHIEFPGLLFHLETRATASADESPRAARLRGKAALVAQALLLQPEREWQVTDLAVDSRVSAALAYRILSRLEREGIVVAQGEGPARIRRVVRPGALLDLWAEENVDRPTRTLAYFLAQTSKQLVEEIGARLGRAGIEYAVTGAAAGSIVAPLVTAVPVVELWVEATAAAETLCIAAGADQVDDGQNVVFLQAKDDAPLVFREQRHDLWLVNRFRLYVDLRRDPRRGREQADHLRREVIAF